jgi:putative hydrolase of the HAD superfamily
MAFFRHLEAAFAERAAWHVFEDVAPALATLRDAGIRLCVISNWTWSLPELLHMLELAGRFDGLVTSARVGYEKPHRRIFEHALALMGVTADAAVHVGDSVHADVGGARRVGIAPVLIARGRHPHATLVGDRLDGTPVIGDLHGLLGLVGLTSPAGPSEMPARD